MHLGDVVDDRFTLEAFAGEGGMGVVYRARDRSTDGVVALKVLRTEGDDAARRFGSEAEMLADLQHPAIVRHVAHGATDEGAPYLVMEWLEGASLADTLLTRRLTLGESLTLAERVAGALAAAHERGIVHRDIKPSNLLLQDGQVERVKVLDFGIARRIATSRSTMSAGTPVGTPGYMAPEQARGSRSVDARSDVFSLGCVLFECLAGRPAFMGDHVVALLAKILLETPPRLREIAPHVPSDLEDLVARMLAKEPEDRPDDARAIVFSLAASVGAAPRSLHLSAPPAALRPSGITAGEQRLLSVVLAGEAHGGASRATLDAEELDHEIGGIKAMVEAFGGHLEPLASGSLIITLSAVRGARDLAALAARCALALRSTWDDAPIAVATGRGVVAGRYPVGEVIERAAKLLPSAGSGRIRLDSITQGLLDARFEVRDPSEPTLIGERDSGDDTHTLLGKPSPCVGRDGETLRIVSTFDACVEEDIAAVILVTGAAGLGKSRLRQEVLRRIEERGSPAEVWMSRGDPMRAGAAFATIAPIVRNACGIQKGEPHESQRGKLRSYLEARVPKSETERLLAFVGELIGIETSADEEGVQLRAARRDAVLMGDQLRRAWEDFIEARWSEHSPDRRPLLIVLDDLQWSDLPSIAFVGSALRRLAGRPWMVLALARPEVSDAFPSLFVDRNLQHVRLGPLGKRASERLVRHALGGSIDEERLAQLASRASGNPYFLEELVRAEAGGAGGELPGSVLAMVQARLERLDAEARRVLRAASVFGKTFWLGGVREVLGGEGGAPELEAWIRQLVGAELLATRHDSKFPHEQEVAFYQALVREAAYGTLTEDDRTLAHRLAGHWLERAGETDAAVLAEHFERASEHERALSWSARAATQALEANDFAAAEAHVERAVRCGAKGEQLGMLRRIQAEALKWIGKNPEAEARGIEAMALLSPGSEAYYAAVGEIAVVAGRCGHVDRLLSLEASLATHPGGASAASLRLVALGRLSTSLLYAGRYEAADRLIASLAEAELSTDPAALARLDSARAVQAMIGGDLSGYLDRLRSAAEHFAEAGDIRMTCVQLCGTGYANLELGAYEVASAQLEEAIETAKRMSIHNVVATGNHNLGLVKARLGALDEGLAIERDAAVAFTEQNNKRMLCAAKTYLSQIRHLQGDLEGALAEAEEAASLVSGAQPVRAQALGSLAAVRLASGDPEGALRDASEALSVLNELGAIDEGESTLRLAYAEALWATNQKEEARAAIALARDSVLLRANKITRPELAQSFRERVPDNARTLALAAAWLGQGALPVDDRAP